MPHRSEEHTSELQSLRHLVCRLLLEKKKHTCELQALRHLVCRLLLEKKNQVRRGRRGRIPPARIPLIHYSPLPVLFFFFFFKGSGTPRIFPFSLPRPFPV